MISRIYQILLFGIASLITLLIWRSFGPGPRPITPEVREKIPLIAPPARWSPNQISAKLDAVKNASTPATQLSACLDLSEVPVADVPDLLENMKSEISQNFSLQAQTLLIRWASSDGEAAANWAWKSFRSGSQWSSAFAQIGPTWAAHNPTEMGKWAINTAKRKPGAWHDSITLAQAEASDTPLLDIDFLPKIPGWLVTESPRAAYEMILATDLGSRVNEVAYSLTSVPAVQEGLLACSEATDPDGTKHNRITEIKNLLLRRWFELDPEDFQHSPYAKDFTIGPSEVVTSIQARWDQWPEDECVKEINHLLTQVDPKYQKDAITQMAIAWAKKDPAATSRWLDTLPPETQASTSVARINALAPLDLSATLDWAEKLPAEKRRDAIVPAYDAWTAAHPGQQPDKTGWPASRVQAWEDLETSQSN